LSTESITYMNGRHNTSKSCLRTCRTQPTTRNGGVMLRRCGLSQCRYCFRSDFVATCYRSASPALQAVMRAVGDRRRDVACLVCVCRPICVECTGEPCQNGQTDGNAVLEQTRVHGPKETMYYMGVHVGTTWQVRLSDACAVHGDVKLSVM